MNSEELMEGEDSELAGTCYKILMIMPEFKRSGIKKIAEFCRISCRFPSQAAALAVLMTLSSRQSALAGFMG